MNVKKYVPIVGAALAVNIAYAENITINDKSYQNIEVMSVDHHSGLVQLKHKAGIIGVKHQSLPIHLQEKHPLKKVEPQADKVAQIVFSDKIPETEEEAKAVLVVLEKEIQKREIKRKKSLFLGKKRSVSGGGSSFNSSGSIEKTGSYTGRRSISGGSSIDQVTTFGKRNVSGSGFTDSGSIKKVGFTGFGLTRSISGGSSFQSGSIETVSTVSGKRNVSGSSFNDSGSIEKVNSFGVSSKRSIGGGGGAFNNGNITKAPKKNGVRSVSGGSSSSNGSIKIYSWKSGDAK